MAGQSESGVEESPHQRSFHVEIGPDYIPYHNREPRFLVTTWRYGHGTSPSPMSLAELRQLRDTLNIFLDS